MNSGAGRKAGHFYEVYERWVLMSSKKQNAFYLIINALG
jgi:hypothetical protein